MSHILTNTPTSDKDFVSPRGPSVPHVERSPEVAERVADFFFLTADRQDIFARWDATPKDGKRPSWKTCHRRLTREILVAHLIGTGEVVGTYMPARDGTVCRVSVDIDGANHRKKADPETPEVKQARCEQQRAALQALLAELGVPYTLALSKGGSGYHVEVYFAERVQARVARRWARQVLERAGLPRETEVFPKQDSGDGVAGGQIARPGSLVWHQKTGGSTYLDPRTRAPVPFEDWPALLEGLGRVSPAQLRDLGLRLGADPFVDPPPAPRPPPEERPAAGRSPWRGRADGSGQFLGPVGRWDVESLRRFLTQRGVALTENMTGPMGSGRWSYRFVLEECPFASRHSDDDRSGAAVLIEESTGKVGFRCHHSHCAEATWQDVRKALDPTLSFRPPRLSGPTRPATERRPPPTEYDFEPDEGYCHAAFEAAQPRPEPEPEPDPDDRDGLTLPVVWQRRFYEAAARLRATGKPEAERLAKRLRRVQTCCKVGHSVGCESHGPVEYEDDARTRARVVPHACDDAMLCVRCVARKVRVECRHILSNWPERLCLARVMLETPGDRAEMARVQRSVMRKYKSHRRPRWVVGWRSVLFVFRASEILNVRTDDVAPDHHVAVMTREEAEPHIRSALLSVRCGVLSILDRTKDAASLMGCPWLTSKVALTGGGRLLGRVDFPWRSLAADREERREKLVQERGGVPLNRCAAIVEGPSGPCACGKKLNDTGYHIPTGQALGVKRGGQFRHDELLKLLDQAPLEARWLFPERHSAAHPHTYRAPT